MTAQAQMMTDWPAYEARHGCRCIVEDPWAGPVDWADTPDGSDWFFVLALGHSGSCVLTRLLSLHPDIYCANEDQTVLGLLGLLTSRTVMTVGNNALHWQQGEWSGREQPFTCETRQVTGGFLREICDVWRKRFGGGKRFVGDKHTGYLHHRDVLRKAFPGCRFLYPVRHPLDQLSGLLHDRWSGNAALAETPAATWAQVCYYVNKFREVAREPDVMAVPYETFAAVGTMAATLQFCARHLGASEGAVRDMPLAPYAKSASVNRWHLDVVVGQHLSEWHRAGRITQQQRWCLEETADQCSRALLECEDWITHA